MLDELTRTPFFLSEVTSIFEAGATIPSTRIGVLEAVTRLVEQSDQHRNHLQQASLSGLAKDYLGALATRMTAQNAVSIADEKARPAVAAVGNLLKEAGQIGAPPDPVSVLATLCAHHVLERQDYPAVAFRFEHQQFQEFYAAVDVGKQLFALVPKPDPHKQLEFTKSSVNEPAWAEPLRLIADDIGGRSAGTEGASAIQVGTLLVTMALTVDPVFAAELARLCGPHVWKEVRAAVGERLRALYASADKNYKASAIAGMLASGSDDFKDIIEPILAGDDQQAALGTYRGWEEFYVSSLGPNWRATVSGWKEEARIAFVSELLHHRNVPDVAALALADPSIRVKQAVRSVVRLPAADSGWTGLGHSRSPKQPNPRLSRGSLAHSRLAHYWARSDAGDPSGGDLWSPAGAGISITRFTTQPTREPPTPAWRTRESRHESLRSRRRYSSHLPFAATLRALPRPVWRKPASLLSKWRARRAHRKSPCPLPTPCAATR